MEKNMRRKIKKFKTITIIVDEKQDITLQFTPVKTLH